MKNQLCFFAAVMIAACGGHSNGTATDDANPWSDAPPVEACSNGTYEFPFRSGICVDDPCDPDPCNGTGTCSNTSGTAVCTTCTLFVDATAGSDSNDGRSPMTAWQTIDAVNRATLMPADNVCFKRGETFAGGLAVTRSGEMSRPLRFGNYGASNLPRPTISGLTNLTGWTAVSAGIWKTACPNCGTTVNIVTVDGRLQPVGRYPNIDAGNSGFLNYESVIGPTDGTAAEGFFPSPYAGVLGIVDNELPVSPNWTGADVVVRKTNYVLDRGLVTSHSGSTILYQNPLQPSVYVGRPGWGYFLENHIATLDQVGEWYYDAANHELNVFFGDAGPGGKSVTASVVPSLVKIGNQHDISFDGIAFVGANQNTVDLNQSKRITITSCDIRRSGRDGVITSATDGVTVAYSSIIQSNDTGILLAQTSKNSVIQNNFVRSSGIIRGAGARMTEPPSGNHSGIHISGSIVEQNALVQGNVVESAGYRGVGFFASGVTVQQNLITQFDQILDDGGGVYTWRGSEVYVNRKVIGNVIMDGPGAAAVPGPEAGKATNAPAGLTGCIYLDNATSNIEVKDNTTARCSRSGILENYARHAFITGNTSFDSRSQIEIWSLANATVVNQVCRDNIFFSRTEQQPVMLVSAVAGTVENFGTFDQNYYIRPFPNDLIINTTLNNNDYRFHSLPAWQAAYGMDANSKQTPVRLRTYGPVAIVGSDLVSNSTFDSGIATIAMFSAGNNASIKANNGSKLTGTGSLEVSFAAPIRQNTSLHLINPGIGAISDQKTYVIRVSTLGTTVNGILGASFRQTKSPFANLAPVQKRSFGRSRIDHEFVFVAPTSDPTATFTLSLDERSGTTYLDQLEVYEVTTPLVDPDKAIRFEVNTSTVSKTVALDGNYIDAKSATYNGSITLAPMTSAILIRQP
jgi:hypothetical protein